MMGYHIQYQILDGKITGGSHMDSVCVPRQACGGGSDRQISAKDKEFYYQFVSYRQRGEYRKEKARGQDNLSDQNHGKWSQ